MPPPPDLPEEILHAIFSNLVPAEPGLVIEEPYGTGSLQTLRSICLVNKQCLRVAQPLLFHTLQLDEFRDNSIRQIAHKFAQYPRLANFARCMCVGGWEPKRGEDDSVEMTDGEPVPPREDVARHVEEALRLTHHSLGPLANSLLAGVKEGWTDAHLAFLLTQCRNLELLQFEVPHVFEQSYTHAVLHHFATTDKYNPTLTAAASPSDIAIGLPKLKVLQVSHWDTENAVKMHDLEGLFTKSTLQIWNGDKINITGVDDYFAFQVDPWPLRRISLNQSLMDAEGLETLLKCCVKLEHFEIQYGSAVVGDECTVDFRKFAQAFCKYGQGLQTISIDDREWEDFSDDYVSHPLGDITALTNLNYLAVTRVALLGDGEADSDLEDEENIEPQVLFETLPASLRTLKIYGDYYNHDANQDKETELDDKLLGLMASDHFPELRAIRIERGNPFSRKDGLQAIGWNASASNEFWVILKRETDIVLAESR